MQARGIPTVRLASCLQKGISKPLRLIGLVLGVSSLALIGNASRADCRGAGSRREAFSIRRLGGSRWRLRRTRCAMGFQPKHRSEQSLGRAVMRGGNVIGMVGEAAAMNK